mgnify:CR=1 FL=1
MRQIFDQRFANPRIVKKLIDSKIGKNLAKPNILGRVKRLEDANDKYIKILKSNNITFWTAIRLQIRRYLFQGYRPIIVLTLIFCSSNFTILYLLSSSPHLVTIELSIYQSIIFNADLYSGMALGIIQLILMLFLSSLILFNPVSYTHLTLPTKA